MASGPITSWQIDGQTVADFIFLGSKITTDGDCSHEIKRHLLLDGKVMTKLDSMLKSRGTRDQIANIHWIIEIAIVQKNFCFIDYANAFLWITTNCGKF